MDKDPIFFDFVYDLFYKTSQCNPEDVGLVFSRKVQYPIMNFVPQLQIIMPLPRMQGDKYVFEGMLFENSENGRRSMWGLFLSSIYHLAAHAAISEYFVYAKWSKSKTKEVYWRVIDFVEDILAEKYLNDIDPLICKNIENINSCLLSLNKPLDIKTKNEHTKNNLQTHYIKKNKLLIEKIKAEIYKKRDGRTHKEDVLSCLDILYKNRHLLPQEILPYCEHHEDEQVLKVEKTGINFEPDEFFEELIIKLDELWEINESSRARILRLYRKHLKGLHFDSIIIPPGNLQNFTKMKSTTMPMLRRIRQQLRTVTNLEDDPKIDEIGYINMQHAIQAIASETQGGEVFDRDELRRGEEAWVILVDSSASVKLKFDKIREFTLCIAESASELTGRSDAWSLYAFDNNLSIIKDFKERYSEDVKARIGDLKNGGLSFLPDALELATRILAADQRERKYIFIITDGHPSGYEDIEDRFKEVVKLIEMSDVILIAIGLSKKITRRFKNSARGSDLKQLVSKFITAYRAASSDAF
jgi:uncharacterized protein YegL